MCIIITEFNSDVETMTSINNEWNIFLSVVKSVIEKMNKLMDKRI